MLLYHNWHTITLSLTHRLLFDTGLQLEDAFWTWQSSVAANFNGLPDYPSSVSSSPGSHRLLSLVRCSSKRRLLQCGGLVKDRWISEIGTCASNNLTLNLRYIFESDASQDWDFKRTAAPSYRCTHFSQPVKTQIESSEPGCFHLCISFLSSCRDSM